MTLGPPPDMSTPTILPRTKSGPSSVATSTWVWKMSRSSTAATPSMPSAMARMAPCGRKPSPLGRARTSYMFVSARLASLEAKRHWVTLLSPAYMPVPMAIIRAMPATWTQRALASLSAQRSLSASMPTPTSYAAPAICGSTLGLEPVPSIRHSLRVRSNSRAALSARPMIY